jgi:medium-chain acyl-[acyl-carrier-protein] hydrolase
VWPVELPGHGARLAEPPAGSVAELTGAMADALLPLLDRPFAVFGHSLGGLVAFELARELRRRGGPEPARLFLSASRPPHLDVGGPLLRAAAEDGFADAVTALGGVPEAVAADPEMLRFGLEVLRADVALLDTYAYADEPPLGCPISLFGAASDRLVELDVIEEWAEHTAAGVSLRVVPGDHFFVTGHERHALLRALGEELHDLAAQAATAGSHA